MKNRLKSGDFSYVARRTWKYCHSSFNTSRPCYARALYSLTVPPTDMGRIPLTFTKRGPIMIATCPTPEQLADLVAATVDEQTAETLIAHVAECANCEATLSKLEREADTFAARLRAPQIASPFVDEPECHNLVGTLITLARGEDAATVMIPTVSLLSPSPSLGQIREYRLIARLGAGGMGTVYQALHTSLGRTVALKVLPADRMSDPNAVARFQREMKAVGRLDHPNIVRAYDAGEQDGTHFLVMEHVEGLDLAALVTTVGPLPIADACELMRQAAVGLQYAHEHGLVHRDI